MQSFGAPSPSKQIISLGRIITKKRGGEGYRVEAEGQMVAEEKHAFQTSDG